MSTRHIVIAGDAPLNLFLYPSPVGLGPGAPLKRSQTHWFRGGASLLALLLEEVEESAPAVRIHEPTPGSSEHDLITSIIQLDIHSRRGKSHGSPTFILKGKQQLNVQHLWYRPASLPPDGDNDSLSLLILNDAEGHFDDSDSQAAIELLRTSRPNFLLYHMARPLCTGKIWEDVRHGPYVDLSNRDPEQVIGMYILGRENGSREMQRF